MSQLSPTKLEEMNSSDLNKLKKNNNKDDLLGYIQSLRCKVDELKSYQLIAKRVQLLERSQLNSLQYQRRESIEICGLPQSIKDEELESSCRDLLQDIGCGTIKGSAIHACHRLKNRDKTIIRFVNRKNADKALHNKKKLANIDKKKYGLTEGNPGIFINESLCRPMQFLSFKVRKAYHAKKIKSYNLWKGKLSIKCNDDKDYVISHIDDLIDLDLADEEDRLSLFT